MKIEAYRQFLRPHVGVVDETPLSNKQQRNLAEFDLALRNRWDLGTNLVLVWSENDNGIDVVVFPTVRLVNKGRGKPQDQHKLDKSIESLISGTREVTPTELAKIARYFGTKPVSVALPYPEERSLPSPLVDELIQSYGIAFDEGRGVILYDIVGFSSLDPLEQIAQINSLSCAIHSAHRKLREKGIVVRFAHSTTGDGFYVWNRASGSDANTNLYHLMHLTLAQNAADRISGPGDAVPLLKTAFLLGDYYTIVQTEGLQPVPYSYIVGKATVRLNRIMEGALPGQILVGDFEIPLSDSSRILDSASFVDNLQSSLSALEKLNIGEETVETVKCYLTGDPIGPAQYSVKERRIIDKHGEMHTAYNAKVNIHCKSGASIYLGIRENELARYETKGS